MTADTEVEKAWAVQEISLLIRLPSGNQRVAERLPDRLTGVRSPKTWCFVLTGQDSSSGEI